MLNDVQKHILQIVADMAGENAPGAVNIRSGRHILPEGESEQAEVLKHNSHGAAQIWNVSFADG